MRKRKVLIVEKQKQMVKYLKDFIPWDELGYEVTSVTQGQDKAMSYYGEYHHELVITNLKLLDGDGMSFISFIRKLNKTSKIIVISDDDSYSSVRKAFITGVNDYLIRMDFKAVDLVNSIKAFENDFTDNANQNWKIELKEFLGGIRDFQNVNYSVLKEAFTKPEFDILNDEYRMIYVRMDNISYVNKGFPIYSYYEMDSIKAFEDMFLLSIRNRQNLENDIKTIIDNYLKMFTDSFYVFTKNHSFISLIKEKDYKKLVNTIGELRNDLENNIDQKFTITISNKYKGYESFLDVYKILLGVNRKKFYIGDGKIIYEDSVKEFNSINLTDITYHHQLLKCFKNGQCNQLNIIFNDILDYFDNKNINPDIVISYFESLFNQMKNITIQNKIDTYQIYDEFILGLKRCETVSMMKSELSRISKVISEIISKTQINKSKRYINSIYKYIENNMNNKISVADIANSLGLTGIHTSRIFKKETKEDLSKYITKRKMEVAAILLESNNLMIKEVANKVGYDDQLYFNKVFKKEYGISPKVYKKTNSKLK